MPEEIEKMESLETLNMQKNLTKQMPKTLNEIKSLKHLYIDGGVEFEKQREINVHYASSEWWLNINKHIQ